MVDRWWWGYLMRTPRSRHLLTGISALSCSNWSIESTGRLFVILLRRWSESGLGLHFQWESSLQNFPLTVLNAVLWVTCHAYCYGCDDANISVWPTVPATIPIWETLLLQLYWKSTNDINSTSRLISVFSIGVFSNTILPLLCINPSSIPPPPRSMKWRNKAIRALSNQWVSAFKFMHVF